MKRIILQRIDLNSVNSKLACEKLLENLSVSDIQLAVSSHIELNVQSIVRIKCRKRDFAIFCMYNFLFWVHLLMFFEEYETWWVCLCWQNKKSHGPNSAAPKPRVPPKIINEVLRNFSFLHYSPPSLVGFDGYNELLCRRRRKFKSLRTPETTPFYFPRMDMFLLLQKSPHLIVFRFQVLVCCCLIITIVAVLF